MVWWSPTGSKAQEAVSPCPVHCRSFAEPCAVTAGCWGQTDRRTDRHTTTSCRFPQRGARSSSACPPALPGPMKPQPLRCCNPPLPVPPQSLPKSHVETRERQTIIPHGVPFMVKLLCYYASEDSIFLHLEHVQGERGQHCLLARSILLLSILQDQIGFSWWFRTFLFF